MALIRSSLTAVAVLGCLARPALAQACSGPTCLPDQFLPRGGSVPANIAAIAWDPGFDVADDETAAARLPRLECTAANGDNRELALVALPEDRPDHLQLSEPLVAGERCTLRSGVSDCSLDSSASYLQESAEFTVAPSSRMPESLGLLAITGPKLEDVELAADASCSESVAACVLHTSLVFSEAALPWKDALLFETLVDGEPFTTWRHLALPDELGGLYSGRENGAIYVMVDDIPENVSTLNQLDAGEHTLSIRARLPGSDLVLATPELNINLDCGRLTQTPLARNEVAAGSDSCAVTGVGSSQRHAVVVALSFAAALLVGARRRKRS